MCVKQTADVWDMIKAPFFLHPSREQGFASVSEAVGADHRSADATAAAQNLDRENSPSLGGLWSSGQLQKGLFSN